MKEDLLDILRCPECKGKLDLEILESNPESENEESQIEIEEGKLECEDCNITYPIEDGIPNMIPPDE